MGVSQFASWQTFHFCIFMAANTSCSLRLQYDSAAQSWRRLGEKQEFSNSPSHIESAVTKCSGNMQGFILRAFYFYGIEFTLATVLSPARVKRLARADSQVSPVDQTWPSASPFLPAESAFPHQFTSAAPNGCGRCRNVSSAAGSPF